MATGLSREQAPPRPAAAVREPRRRGNTGLILLIIGVLLLFAAVWIGARGYEAHQELVAAVPDVRAVRAAIEAGNASSAQAAADDLRKRAHHAAELTSDPVWQAAEVIPWVGANLSAVSAVADATDIIATHVVRPLVGVADSIDPRSLKLAGGRIDLAPLLKAQPVAEKAQTAFETAQHEVASIDERSIISPIAAAVGSMRTELSSVAPDMEAVGNTARLLPAMLGATGPRTYLVVAQNPAELRSTGGLIGSIAEIGTDKGAISLRAQAAGTSIGPWDNPVSAVPQATTNLYGPLVGRYMQDVNYTPDFPLAARTAAAMWVRSRGGVVDGVIAVDPVVLSAFLKATGPVTLPSGDVLTSANAVQLLLSGVYARYPNQPHLQDAFFSSATSAVFDRISNGRIDGGALASALASALAAAGSSGRLHIWSSRPAEQSVLQTTSLAGVLPISDAQTAALGVYFNDATGSKMDYYLSTSVSAGAAVCRVDERVTSLVEVALRNNAPADAAKTLPAYVTGDGTYGVPPGSIRTRIAFYGPEKGLLAGVKSKGSEIPSLAGTDAGRPVAVVEVQLAPGESETIDVQFLGTVQKVPGVKVDVTPTLKGDGSTPDVGAPTKVRAIAVPCTQP